MAKRFTDRVNTITDEVTDAVVQSVVAAAVAGISSPFAMLWEDGAEIDWEDDVTIDWEKVF